MSSLRERTEFGDLPLYLPEQNAVLIGRIIGGDPVLEGKAAYYIHWRDGIHFGDYDAARHSFAPELALEADSRVMSNQAKEFNDLEAEVALSTIGGPLIDAYEYAMTEQLPEQQAHIFALLDNGFARQEVALILNISPSTVDTQRMSAQQKVDAAYAFVELHQAKQRAESVGIERDQI